MAVPVGSPLASREIFHKGLFFHTLLIREFKFEVQF